MSLQLCFRLYATAKKNYMFLRLCFSIYSSAEEITCSCSYVSESMLLRRNIMSLQLCFSAYRKTSIKPLGALFNFGPSREGLVHKIKSQGYIW